MKATYCEIDGKPKEIFKDPKTTIASGMSKKSLRGLIKVDYDENGIIKAYDRVTPEQENEGLLHVVFENGVMYNQVSLSDIRKIRNAEALKVVESQIENK